MVGTSFIPSNANATFVQSTRLLKPSRLCHVVIHWIALAEYSQISTHVPGFQLFSGVLHHLVLDKLATSSILGLYNLSQQGIWASIGNPNYQK